MADGRSNKIGTSDNFRLRVISLSCPWRPSLASSLFYFLSSLLHSLPPPLRLLSPPASSFSQLLVHAARPPTTSNISFSPSSVRLGSNPTKERRREKRENEWIIISKSLQIFTQKAYRVSCGGSEMRRHLPSYRFQLIASRRLRLVPCKTPRVRSRVFAQGYVCTRPPTGNDHYRAVVDMMVRAGVSTGTSNFRGKDRMTVTDESPLRSQV